VSARPARSTASRACRTADCACDACARSASTSLGATAPRPCSASASASWRWISARFCSAVRAAAAACVTASVELRRARSSWMRACASASSAPSTATRAWASSSRTSGSPSATVAPSRARIAATRPVAPEATRLSCAGRRVTEALRVAVSGPTVAGAARTARAASGVVAALLVEAPDAASSEPLPQAIRPAPRPRTSASAIAVARRRRGAGRVGAPAAAVVVATAAASAPVVATAVVGASAAIPSLQRHERAGLQVEQREHEAVLGLHGAQLRLAGRQPDLLERDLGDQPGVEAAQLDRLAFARLGERVAGDAVGLAGGDDRVQQGAGAQREAAAGLGGAGLGLGELRAGLVDLGARGEARVEQVDADAGELDRVGDLQQGGQAVERGLEDGVRRQRALEALALQRGPGRPGRRGR
jgi:hypothetical protein